MQTHEIKRKNPNKTKKRIGRGGKRGDYSGRGNKGQGQHASSAPRPELRDIIKKIPKKRGYRFSSIKADFYVANVGSLDSVFKNNEKVTPKTLVSKGVIDVKKGENPKIKILGSGTITKKLKVSGCSFSKTAKEKIEKIGGKIVEDKSTI